MKKKQKEKERHLKHLSELISFLNDLKRKIETGVASKNEIDCLISMTVAKDTHLEDTEIIELLQPEPPIELETELPIDKSEVDDPDNQKLTS